LGFSLAHMNTDLHQNTLSLSHTKIRTQHTYAPIYTYINIHTPHTQFHSPHTTHTNTMHIRTCTYDYIRIYTHPLPLSLTHTNTQTCRHTNTHNTHKCTHTHTYTYTHTHIHTHTHTHTHIHTHIRTHVRTHIRTHIPASPEAPCCRSCQDQWHRAACRSMPAAHRASVKKIVIAFVFANFQLRSVRFHSRLTLVT